jgi:mono-ADP-ribosyltransferase sirtuin 6
LHDSIINFGESLPANHLQRAFDHAKKSDLCLVLGSSLMVTPANEIPEVVGQRKGAKLAICNLQKTPLDGLSDLRIHSKTDDLMIRVMEKLDIPIPPFILHRRLAVELETKDNRHQLTIRGVDVDGTPVTFLRSVKLEYNRRVARSEPFVINFRGDLDSGTQLKLELEFMGHYGEPNLEIIHEYHNEKDTQTLHLLEYNPHTGEWRASKQSGPDAGDRTQDDIEKQNDEPILIEDDSVLEYLEPTPAADALPEIAV